MKGRGRRAPIPVSHVVLAHRDAEGAVESYSAIMRDVTERMAAERQALLAREVDHRAKNALAVVQAALRLTPRTMRRATPAPWRAASARWRARIRCWPRRAGRGASLRALAEAELSAFLPPGPAGGAGRAVGGAGS